MNSISKIHDEKIKLERMKKRLLKLKTKGRRQNIEEKLIDVENKIASYMKELQDKCNHPIWHIDRNLNLQLDELNTSCLICLKKMKVSYDRLPKHIIFSNHSAERLSLYLKKQIKDLDNHKKVEEFVKVMEKRFCFSIPLYK